MAGSKITGCNAVRPSTNICPDLNFFDRPGQTVLKAHNDPFCVVNCSSHECVPLEAIGEHARIDTGCVGRTTLTFPSQEPGGRVFADVMLATSSLALTGAIGFRLQASVSFLVYSFTFVSSVFVSVATLASWAWCAASYSSGHNAAASFVAALTRQTSCNSSARYAQVPLLRRVRANGYWS